MKNGPKNRVDRFASREPHELQKTEITTNIKSSAKFPTTITWISEFFCSEVRISCLLCKSITDFRRNDCIFKAPIFSFVVRFGSNQWREKLQFRTNSTQIPQNVYLLNKIEQKLDLIHIIRHTKSNSVLNYKPQKLEFLELNH